MSEKFSLKWNDFHSNVSKSFGLFRNEEYLHDVTLVSDDHKQFSAHKLVLSACSEYFKDIFKQNNKPNAHPLLCLDGVSSDDLKNIMDYIYNGEVQLYQEKLDNFLSIAQRLKLEGLIGNNDGDFQPENFDNKIIDKDEDIAEDTHYDNYKTISNKPHHNSKPPRQRQIESVDKVMVPISAEVVSEVENAVSQHIEKIDAGMWKCNLCGKTAAKSQNLKNHIETHLEGLSFPCQLCGKTFRSRRSTHKCFRNL